MLFRNAPRCGGGPSPAENLFGRPIRDGLPAHARSFKKEWQRQSEELERRTEAAREKSIEFDNATAHPLTALTVGDHVLIQDPDSSLWSTPGKVIEIGPDRDYLVQMANGKEFRHNRRHLLRRTPMMTGQPGGQHAATAEPTAPGPPATNEPAEPTATNEPAKPTATNEPAKPTATNEPAEPVATATPPPTRRSRRNRSQNARPTRQQPTRVHRPVYDVNNPNSEWAK